MNPFSKTYTNARGDEVLAGSTQFTRPGSAEPIVASNGEINASNKADLMKGISALMALASAGQVKKTEEKAVATAADHKAMLAEAAASQDAAVALAETFTAQVNETLGRDGFARRLMQFRQLNNGDVFQVRLRQRDTLAFVTTSNPNTIASVARQNFVIPEMFDISVNVNVEKIEIAKDTGDLLQDRYEDALEQVMCAEDRVFLKLAKAASGVYNSPFGFTNFTPEVCAAMRTAIQSNGGIPVTQMLVSYDIWNDMIANPEFTAFYSEIAKHELVLEGNLGTMMGMNIVTDGSRIETLRVLPENTVYMFGAPETLGVIGQWGDMSVDNVNKANQGRAVLGWFINLIEGMCIGNARSVSRGVRVA